MPITKSAMKRMRTSRRKHVANASVLTHLKNLSKNFLKTVAAANAEQATKDAVVIVREYDKAASLGVIPRARADRKKARVALALQKLSRAKTDNK